MGNQTSVMNSDRFKDQICSLVLYHMAQQANPDFRFALRDNCTPDQLPAPESNDYRSLLNCYRLEDPKVAAYVNKHILNKEENLARFYQTLIHHLRTVPSPNNNRQRGGSNKQPLTRSQVERLSNPTTKSQGKSQTRSYTHNNRQNHQQAQSTYKTGEFLEDGDMVTVNFPELQTGQTDLYNNQLRETKMKLLSMFLSPDNQNETDLSELERQIDEELDREFADLDNVDFDNLDLETIHTRIADRREEIKSSKSRNIPSDRRSNNSTNNYPTEANYNSKTSSAKPKPTAISQKPETPSPSSQAIKPTTTSSKEDLLTPYPQKKSQSKTVKSELDEIYYQPNQSPANPSSSQQQTDKNPFGTRCMIEED